MDVLLSFINRWSKPQQLMRSGSCLYPLIGNGFFICPHPPSREMRRFPLTAGGLRTCRTNLERIRSLSNRFQIPLAEGGRFQGKGLSILVGAEMAENFITSIRKAESFPFQSRPTVTANTENQLRSFRRRSRSGSASFKARTIH